MSRLHLIQYHMHMLPMKLASVTCMVVPIEYVMTRVLGHLNHLMHVRFTSHPKSLLVARVPSDVDKSYLRSIAHVYVTTCVLGYPNHSMHIWVISYSRSHLVNMGLHLIQTHVINIVSSEVDKCCMCEIAYVMLCVLSHQPPNACQDYNSSKVTFVWHISN